MLGKDIRMLLLMSFVPGIWSKFEDESNYIDIDRIIDFFGGDECVEGIIMSTPIGTPYYYSRNYYTPVSSPVRNRMVKLTDVTIKPSSLKNKTPMCIINELARYNDVDHKYTLTEENGPAHEKTFTVNLNLGSEIFVGYGTSIKRAQHDAAATAIRCTKYPQPPPKLVSVKPKKMTPTVELNTVAMKRGLQPSYEVIYQPPVSGSAICSVSPQSMYEPSSFCWSDTRYNNTEQNRFVEKQSPLYRVLLSVGEQQYFGTGFTEQKARHNAAKKALEYLGKQPLTQGCISSDAEKSPVSEVYEIAMKLNYPVVFNDIHSYGPSHVRVYETECTVGQSYKTTGNGNSKKAAKTKAAVEMLKILKGIPILAKSPVNKNRKFKNHLRKRSKSAQRGENSQKASEQKIQEISASSAGNENNAVMQLNQHLRNLMLDMPGRVPELQGHLPVAGVVEKKIVGNSTNLGHVTQDNVDIQGAENKQKQKMDESSEQKRSPVRGKVITPGLMFVPQESFPQDKGRTTFKGYNKHPTQMEAIVSEWRNDATNSTDSIQCISNAEQLLNTISASLGIHSQITQFPKTSKGDNVAVAQIVSTPPISCIGVTGMPDESRNVAATQMLKQLNNKGMLNMEVNRSEDGKGIVKITFKSSSVLRK